jgi:predicted signal transduction protein with EAL and GGDEF domain
MVNMLGKSPVGEPSFEFRVLPRSFGTTGIVARINDDSTGNALEAIDSFFEAGRGLRSHGIDLRIGMELACGLIEDQAIVDRIERGVSRITGAAHKLELVFGESDLIKDFHQGFPVIRTLKGLGFDLGIHEFGKDQSFLPALIGSGISSIQIDESFSTSADPTNDASSTPSKIVLRRLIEIANCLRCEARVKGVSSRAHAEALSEMKVNSLVGYWGRGLSYDQVLLAIYDANTCDERQLISSLLGRRKP